MDGFQLLALACAAALFLFGMELLRSGLSALSQHNIQPLLAHAAESAWRAVALGAVATIFVQSSSVVTSIIVGLAAGGIISLEQSAGLIAGANLGTCSTAFLVHFGLHADFLNVLNRREFFLLLGLFIPFLLHRRCPAPLVCGGGIFALLTGMVHMQSALEPLSHTPLFSQLLSTCTAPLAGLCAGCLATAVLQSSSACIAILQAASSSGTLSVGCAVPIILGQNIGTCSTALLASVKSGTAARCAALLHLAFNITGAAVTLPVFQILRFLYPQLMAQPIDSIGIAYVHLMCNAAAVVPFYLIFQHNPRVRNMPALLRRDR